MNFSMKLVLAGLAVTLVLIPACTHHRRRGGGGGGDETKNGCGVLPCGQGPGAGHHYGQTDRTFEVYIYTDREDSTKCYADVDVGTLWTMTQKHNGKPVNQNVTWFSDDNKDYTVAFDTRKGSPFEASVFHVVGPSYKKNSGKIIKGGDYYEYSIYSGDNATGTPCLKAEDPGWHVNP
jgi:hypothetical protein